MLVKKYVKTWQLCVQIKNKEMSEIWVFVLLGRHLAVRGSPKLPDVLGESDWKSSGQSRLVARNEAARSRERTAYINFWLHWLRFPMGFLCYKVNARVSLKDGVRPTLAQVTETFSPSDLPPGRRCLQPMWPSHSGLKSQTSLQPKFFHPKGCRPIAICIRSPLYDHVKDLCQDGKSVSVIIIRVIILVMLSMS
jgi:hypothetical protein